MFGRLKKWISVSEEQFHEPSNRLKRLEKLLGFEISEEHQVIFLRALRHRSIIDGNDIQAYETYERLEFLGDAVLDLIVTEILFEEYPHENEGFLTKLRAKIVRGNTLALLARTLKINEVLEIGDRATGQGIEVSKSILADLFEAVVAAIYLSKGYPFTREFVAEQISKNINLKKLASRTDNYKSSLMEFLQAKNDPLPEYRVLEEEGPAHNKTFNVAVFITGNKMAEGTGKSKKEAEQKAAKKALDQLRSDL